MSRWGRRIAAALVSVVAAVGLMTVAAAPAAADTVTAKYQAYLGTGGMWYIDPQLTVTAPTTTNVGATKSIEASFRMLWPSRFGEVPANELDNGWMSLQLEGAGSGTLSIREMTHPRLVPGEWATFSGSAEYSYSNAGTVTYRPACFSPNSGLVFCPVGNQSVPIADTTQVS
ncbi:hypothetical protein [Amycolatopsis sp. YIM 10]|uniref:hypothetical protein n=1 Tax=Amycolatopsis sp. YIM 10 TaxID=2653857 RepID=UPI00128FDFA7|nr:hypothetical protein [Amycolatopsis sp. YIM 10]QFU89234.1 hypothetical protein YIM_20275 [Amycolatopsis sp. YIM 10]